MSTRYPLIAGNWKMHGTRILVTELLTGLQTAATGLREEVELAVFPPYVFLEQTQRLLRNTAIRWGGQNMALSMNAANTGEISGSMLLEFGCHYVLLGHSERRNLYGETNIVISQKLRLAQQLGLTPILCVGETLKQRQTGQTESVIQQQLQPVLDLGIKSLQNLVLAYEPIWAIGTGLSASTEQAQAVHTWLRQQIAHYDKLLAQKLRILYGGSLRAHNAEALLAMPDVDGGLIGGASLDLCEFLQIYHLIT